MFLLRGARQEIIINPLGEKKKMWISVRHVLTGTNDGPQHSCERHILHGFSTTE